jgi:hypothetical protein
MPSSPRSSIGRSILRSPYIRRCTTQRRHAGVRSAYPSLRWNNITQNHLEMHLCRAWTGKGLG